jgi:hypothetical protein
VSAQQLLIRLLATARDVAKDVEGDDASAARNGKNAAVQACRSHATTPDSKSPWCLEMFFRSAQKGSANECVITRAGLTSVSRGRNPAREAFHFRNTAKFFCFPGVL